MQILFKVVQQTGGDLIKERIQPQKQPDSRHRQQEKDRLQGVKGLYLQQGQLFLLLEIV